MTTTIETADISNAFIRGMVQIFWGMAWADHAEAHGCCNLSGCEITSMMPEAPIEALILAGELVGRIEQTNGMGIAAIYSQAMQADGVDADDVSYQGDDAERFGNCMAYMATGGGVSWYDSHAEFNLPGDFGKPRKAFVMPRISDDEMRPLADSLCIDAGDKDRCEACGAYNEPDEECSECAAMAERDAADIAKGERPCVLCGATLVSGAVCKRDCYKPEEKCPTLATDNDAEVKRFANGLAALGGLGLLD